MTERALVIGGTGPTGPAVVLGLQQRGYQVEILHRGTHELNELAGLRHIHADPHFRETLDEALRDSEYDVAIATYGRLRHVAGALAGRCSTFVAVTGAPVYDGYFKPDSVFPRGMPILAAEEFADARAPADDAGPASDFSQSIRTAERAVWELHDSGAFKATVFRYPSIYGPRQVYPREWSVIKRVVDGRPFMIIPDAGLTIQMRCAAVNAAAFVLAAIDRPAAAAGETFNAGDLQQYSLLQWIQLIAQFAGRELELVSLPFELAGPGRALFPVPHTEHGLLSIEKAGTLLGYREAMPAPTALQHTVEWYLANPPDDQTQARLKDTFDYTAEDRVVREYDRITAGLRAEASADDAREHPYAHPTAPDLGADHRGR